MSLLLFVFIIFNIIIFQKKKKIRDIFLLHMAILFIVEISTFDGVLFSIGNVNVYLIRVEYLICTILSLVIILNNHKRISNRLLLLSLAYLMIPILAVLWQGVFPYSGLVPSTIDGNWDGYILGTGSLRGYEFNLGQFIKEYVKVIQFITWVIAFKTIVTNEDIYKIINTIIKYYKIILTYGVLEFVVKDVIRTPDVMYSLIVPFLGIKETHGTWVRGSSVTLHGLTWEPSFYVLAMFMVAILIIVLHFIDSGNSHKNNHWRMLLIMLFLMTFSTGFTVVWSGFVLAVVYCYFKVKTGQVKNINKLVKYCIGSVGVAVCVVAVFVIFDENMYIYNRLNATIDVFKYFIVNDFNNIPTFMIDIEGAASAISRFYSIFHCFGVFLDRPLFGLGLASIWAHDVTATTLAQYGLCGGIIWWLLIKSPRKDSNRYDKTFCFIAVIFAGLPTGVMCYEGGFGHAMCFVLLIEAASLIKYKKSRVMQQQVHIDNCPLNNARLDIKENT